jgi:uncharacterized protein involved in exopolysaccharide biosynthesis
MVILASSAIVGVVVSLLLPVRYEAQTTLSPAPSTNDRLALGSALATLGGQFGIDLGAAEGRTQLRFYPTLLQSTWLLTRLANTTRVGDTTLATLLLGQEASAPDTLSQRQLDRLLAELRRSVRVEVDDRANVFTVWIRLPNRAMALAAAERLIALVTEFDTRVRRTRASENRRFLESRTDSERVALAGAEDDLARFEQRNRAFTQSPDLNLDHQRLQRQVTLLQDVYLALARNLEQARIDEVKETPVLTIVDPPSARWRKAEPRRIQIVAAALALGALVVLALGFLPADWRSWTQGQAG